MTDWSRAASQENRRSNSSEVGAPPPQTSGIVINLRASIADECAISHAKSETKMARYWLHIVCQKSYLDKAGCLFDTPEQALAYARTIERELAADGTYRGCAIRVVDEQDREVALLRIGQTKS
jgi:hypothetical protein